jgi:hypothetical protein
VHRDLGVWIVTLAAAGALLGAFLHRTRAPRGPLILFLAACGAALGVGGALIEGEAGVEQATAAALILAILTPFHVRVVLGPAGPSR